MFNADFDRKVYLFLAIALGILSVGAAFTAYVLWPPNTWVGYEPAQPIAFSHKLHAGELKVDCQYCHTNVSKGAQATVPSLKTCMNCHTQVQTKDEKGQLKPDIAKLLHHWDTQEPILWKKVYDLPDFAYFDHSRHISSGIDCIECHGDIANMVRVKRVYPLGMKECLACHRKPSAKTGAPNQAPITCGTCHR
ncbi:MAG: cytochrome c3 family protein [Fibrobacteria bacterium]|nr:cytochrome c3 family protein [Fibrobacteria bacterium]